MAFTTTSGASSVFKRTRGPARQSHLTWKTGEEDGRVTRSQRRRMAVSGNSTRQDARQESAVLPKNVTYDAGFLGKLEADAILQQLRAQVPLKQGEIKMFGKVIKEPRLTAWYGEPYKYSGRMLPATPMSKVPVLAELGRRVSEAIHVPLNSVLINLYRDGSDYMGWHSDAERELGPHANDIVIASAREFRMKSRQDSPKASYNVVLGHGSLLVMRGETQQHYKHMVPKSKKVLGERINLTFRCVDRGLDKGKTNNSEGG